MKSILLSLLLLSVCIGASAHQPVSPQSVKAATTPAVLQFATKAQEQAYYRYRRDKHGQLRSEYDTLSRLISRRTDSIGVNGPGMSPIDTSYLSYSGTRGGDDNSPWFAQKSDVDVFQYYDPTGDTGINTVEYLQTFDANNNIVTDTQLIWSGASWEDNTLYTYGYDANQRLDTVSFYSSSPGGFSGVWQSIYQYDASGNLLSETDLINGGTWIPNNLYTYTYNNFNEPITKSWSSWTGSAWQGMTDDTLTYNNSYGYILSDAEDTIVGTTASHYYLTTYFNNPGGPNHSPDTVLLQTWNDNNNQYLNVQMNVYTYSGNEMTNQFDIWDSFNLVFDTVSRVIDLYDPIGFVTSETNQNYLASAWVNNTLDSFRYDQTANSNLIFDQSTTWNGTTWGSQGDQQYTWTYNNYNQWVTENYSQLDTPAGWTPTSNYYWWYQPYAVPTGINELSKGFASDVYPNPFSNSFTVAFDAEAAGIATLRVYDITGRLITSTSSAVSPGSNAMPWDAGYTLPSGMYTYELSLGSAVSRGKIVSE